MNSKIYHQKRFRFFLQKLNISNLTDQLDSYTSVDLNDEESQIVLELKLKALILDTIHYIQVVEDLLEHKVRSLDNWMWKKQLRFYLGSNNIAQISMVDADFEYTYEYQGNASKLVHTPLTDKCYLTLTQGKFSVGFYSDGLRSLRFSLSSKAKL